MKQGISGIIGVVNRHTAVSISVDVMLHDVTKVVCVTGGEHFGAVAVALLGGG